MGTLHLIKALLSIILSGDESKHPILLLRGADCCMTESDMAAEGEEWKVIVRGAEQRLVQTVTILGGRIEMSQEPSSETKALF